MIPNVRVVGRDGRTPRRRIKGLEFNMEVLGFAEQALYKLPVKGPQEVTVGDAAPEFQQAPCVGFSKVSCEHRLIDPEGRLVASRHAMAVPMGERLSPSSPRSVALTRWKATVPRERTELLADKQVEVTVHEVAGETSRRLYIMPWVLFGFGCARGCTQCTYRSVRGRAKEGVTHSGGCRGGIRKSLLGSQAGRDKHVVKRYTERSDGEIAEALQKEDGRLKGVGVMVAELRVGSAVAATAKVALWRKRRGP